LISTIQGAENIDVWRHKILIPSVPETQLIFSGFGDPKY